ncbi:Metal-dependent hydrolase/cyclase [Staphylococcus aureus]|uniref:Metal-dependent hydrolase/cyclase n=1 Tax=Staphylococcus aureus TaxID=1280 RepID=A0A380DJN8_STAAU|nr:Metal-dependent hydrolase/cyclase [Staphylococcus aureus]
MVLLNLALLLHFVPIGQNVGLILKTFENKDSNGQQHAPGWGLDALKYLIEERRVEAVGHETFDTDASVDVVKKW